VEEIKDTGLLYTPADITPYCIRFLKINCYCCWPD